MASMRHTPEEWQEIGSAGLRQFMGFIEEAHTADLRWPGVQPLYSRLRRSDPEMAVVRNIFTALARSVDIEWELPDDPSDDDQAAQEFAESVIEDMEGGADRFLETLVSQVPFMGWGWWEAVPGLRDPKWTPPDGDPWRSQNADGRVGFRRLAWRDTSSFHAWDFDDFGRLRGMVQQNFPKSSVTIPLDRSLHLTFGDSNNPEGLAGLEPVWRLERIKYGLEQIQGIGFEHAAGYLDVTAEKGLTPADRIEVNKVARAILTAQEGNFAAWPKGVTGEVKDINFSAAPAILEAIKYFGILKLTVFMMQWVALSATTGAGSYAAMDDSSSMFIVFFNAMMEGFARQIDAQIGRRLFEMNPNAFPGMTKRPRLTISRVEKKVSLGELASLLSPLKNFMPLGDEDYKAVRKIIKFPETLPEVEAQPEPTPPATDPTADDNPEDGAGETPDDTQAQVQQSLTRYREWCREHDPITYTSLMREVR